VNFYILVRISTYTGQILAEISNLIQYYLDAQIRNYVQVTYTGCSAYHAAETGLNTGLVQATLLYKRVCSVI